MWVETLRPAGNCPRSTARSNAVFIHRNAVDRSHEMMRSLSRFLL